MRAKSTSSLVAFVTTSVCALVVLLVCVGVNKGKNLSTELAFENKHEYLDGFVWTAPYPGAGPVTPAWVKTPASVGQGALNANDADRRESNVLDAVEFPDYAIAQRTSHGLKQNMQKLSLVQINPRTNPLLWVGSPQKMLPPDGDYPGGATGIPEDGYIAYETGWANEGPFHGELAPMQEAGIASVVKNKRHVNGRPLRMLSILDPGSQPAPFNDWDLGNFGAPLDRTYRPEIWDNPDTQPLDWINAGKLTCVMGSDCHDRTHQGGVHDNGNQYYDNFFTGSIDPNSDKAVNPEYARRTPKSRRQAQKA